MQFNQDDAIDEIRSRGDLEIELARLAIRLQRASSHVVQGASSVDAEERRIALVDWFDSISDELLSRTDPSLKPYARSRIAIIGARCRVLEHPPGTTTDGLEPASTALLRDIASRLDRHTL